jgi:glycosyltransferase involved in cell wall biosynthesis
MSNKGKNFYYIQHYEKIFSGIASDPELAEKSYLLPLTPLVVSKWLAELIKEKTGKTALYVGDGVNPDVFKPTKPKEKLVVLGFVRGMKWKGDEDLLRAFELIQKRVPGVKFRIVGSKRAVNKITNKLNIKLNCEIIENPKDSAIADLYSSSSVFVFASHLEGFGLPPLEAMACGTPVVTTSCRGIDDYAINNHNTIIVKPKDPEGIANAVTKVLNSCSLQTKLIKNGFLTAKTFSWVKVADRVEKHFKKSNR